MEIDQYTLMLININIKLVRSNLQYNDELILICYLWIFIFAVYIFSILKKYKQHTINLASFNF